ncbi:S9 family peptidase [Daejeonella oryzae]|uniref:S9 family peptidase n=1 Tax=Daejeonella oryzae TaxID=1122943 RepID=UPI000421A51B|nr:prolyl oligopeptidase family serine peptidase [Daejeonella oryzae]
MRCFLFVVLFISVNLTANSQSKKPLDHSVYDSWQSISSERISNNGHWVLYSVTPQEGDALLRITNLKSKSSVQIPRVNSAEFTQNSKYAVFMIKPFFKDTRQAKIKKKKADDMPKDSLGILSLGSTNVWKAPRIKSYLIPENSSEYIVYLKDISIADSISKKSGAAKKDDDYFFADEEPAASKQKDGTELVLRNLNTGTERIFNYVTDYSISKNGKNLAFVSTGSKKDSVNKPGLYFYDIAEEKLLKISSGKGQYKNLAFDEDGDQLAFLSEKAPEKTLQKFYKLYYFTALQDSATIIADQKTEGIPLNWSVSGDGKVYFSKNGQKLYFGTAPIQLPKDTTIVDFEVAKVDVWNYKDDYLQPMQLKNLEKNLKRNYLAVLYPKAGSKKIIQLGDEKLPDIQIADEGNAEYAMAETDFGNRIEMQWTGGTLQNIYVVSTIDGSRKMIAENVRGNSSISPKGNYVAWYNRIDKNWYAYSISEKKQIQLNTGLNIQFYNEENDVPDEPYPYGVATWTKDDKNVLIYDRYDIWSFDPANGRSINLTNGIGREQKITFRYTTLDPKEKFIDSRQAIYLQAFDNISKKHGWYKKNISNSKNPQLLVMTGYSYSRPEKAKDADILVYEKSNYTASPDLYVSNGFKQEVKLSSINQQQSNYNWGTAELVKWNTPKGYKSEGILYKPENFDPTKKYPMIVYFYEKLSDGLYNYHAPAPTPSRLNISFFVSNGYLVFAPDISYEAGYPGKSAEEFINSGVEELKKNTWVDGTKIGIQGQSWGGYQVAHLITRTNMYAAAWAGAPVVNMTSAYGGIRWESGMNRQFQYERTQSRIGATLWEKPELYIENSPLFHFPKVNTPVVIMANDADGAVPWYQGIEMFTGLRRLGKPVWMLNYNNEAHNLVLRQNRKDIQIREQQFFDHYLKGKPAPAWMEKGVPATEKGKNWGFEIPASVN